MSESMRLVRVRVRAFALAADLLGRRETDVILHPGATVGELLDMLFRASPPLARLGDRLLVAVDSEYVPRSHPIPDGVEVVLIPPVSGGAES
jgi:molybdopterin converting factor small subunit